MPAAVAVSILVTAQNARADRYEATLRVQSQGVVARVDEDGARAPVLVAGGGLSAGLSWGVRNWLDIGGELVGVGLTQARYDNATAQVFFMDTTGTLSRTSRLAQMRGVATLRLGVGWVPTLQAVVGVGARQRSAARFTYGSEIVVPDGAGSEITVDAIAGVRLGLDRRVTRRWTFGISAGVSAGIGVGAPSLQMFDAGVALAYTWYPLW